MPEMPDPVSGCPILNAVHTKSNKKAWVTNFLTKLSALPATSLVDVGTDSTVKALDPSNEYDSGPHPYAEDEWLKRLWFDPAYASRSWWWQKIAKRAGFEQKVREGFIEACALSLQPPRRRIRAYWICVGDVLDVKVAEVKLPRKEIRVSILTPPPEDECLPHIDP